MPLVLSGTDGVSGVDGTASNPAIEGTDSNTGIFYPAADTVAIGTGGTEALRVNSSQNVGIGTTSPRSRLDVTVTSGTFYQYLTNTGTGDAGVRMQSSTTADYAIFADSANALRFYDFKAVAERARITSGGILGMTENTTKGAYISAQSGVSVASGSTVNLTAAGAGAVLICVYDNTSGNGGVFFGSYTTTITKIAGDGAATDTGAGIAVYKNANSHTITFKNKYADTRTFNFGIYSANAAP